MPVGHPLFLFSVRKRTMYESDVHQHIGLCAVRGLRAESGLQNCLMLTKFDSGDPEEGPHGPSKWF